MFSSCTENDTKKKSGCSCSPYPTINISSIFTSQNSKNGDNSNDEIRNQVKNACAQYGCFHVQIDTSSLPLHIQHILSPLKDETELKKTVDTLFQQDFVQSILNKSSSKNDSDNGDATIAISTSTKSVKFNCKDDDKVYTATYRGRCAESGSKMSTMKQGEPKQSWEIFRNPDSSNNPNTLGVVESVSECDTSKLQILQSFVCALHEVVVALCLDILELPEKNFVCDRTVDSKIKSIDLLRVFRYDALSTVEEQLSNLGSSSHTDWGSMTAVWQDSSGGLQIYCHEHECWNDVEVVGTGKYNNDSLVNIFIHVGDYLSLAMNSMIDSKYNVEAREYSNGQLQWASPTHRVLCPLRMNKNTNEQNECRCSLVYFAYPPKGVSLYDAIHSLQEFNYNGDADNKKPKRRMFPYSQFMVLNNQSTVRDGIKNNDVEKIAQDAFERVLHSPFHDIIENKWKQVQR